VPPAYPNINAHQSRDAGIVTVSGPLKDPKHPVDDLVKTHVFATVAQQPGPRRMTPAPRAGNDDLEGPDGVMGTADYSWDADFEDWSLAVAPAGDTPFEPDAWAWVNAVAVRIYTNGNVDTVSWSRWVQIVPPS
jgi:hypothetical protein